VTWHLRYRLSYRDLESVFPEQGIEINHRTIARWVWTYGPLIEKRLR
jgi:transposase, IS6 family